ncbi:MAG: DUF3060 domain-containing protein [Chitinophagales bacterium]
MKKYTFLSFLLVFVCVNILAQGTNTKTAKSVDIATVSSDAIKFTDSNKEEEIIVDGKDVILSGNDNKLTFKGTIGKILITGKDNDITIVTVNKITVTGNGNFVSWEKSTTANGKPIVEDKGGYNNIEKRSSDAIDRSDN